MNKSMKSKKLWWWIGAGGAIGIGVLVVALASGTSQPLTVDAVSQTADATWRAVDAEVAKRPDWHLQRTVGGTYELELHLTVQSTTAQGSKTEEVALAGTVALQPALEASADGWVVGEFQDLRATGSTTLQAQLGLTGEQSNHAVRTPFAVRVDASGEVVERRYASALPEGLCNLVATLTAGIQVARDAGDANTWQRAEQGATETQYARYTRAGGQITKTWSRTRADAADAVDKDDVRADGQVALQFAHGQMMTVAYNHSLYADLSLVRDVPQRHEVTTRIRLNRKFKHDPAWARNVRVKELPAHRQTPRRPVQREGQASGRSVAEIVARSGEAQRARNWYQRRAEMHDLALTIRDNPQRLAEVVANLQTPGLDGDALRTQLEALVVARTPETLATLRTLLLDKSAPYYARFGAASLATTVADPEPALMDALRQVSYDEQDPVYVAAVLALAGQARLRQGDRPELAATLGTEVTTRASASFALDKATPGHGDASASHNPGLWLQAAGTVGGEAMWPVISPYLVDKRESMRQYAVEALRFVPRPEARVALAMALQKDPSDRVRRQAAEIAVYHPQQAMEEPVVRALREDPSSTVQVGAAYTLAVWGVTSPSLYKEIKQAAAKTQNPQLAKILEGLQPENLDETEAAAAGGAP